MELSEKLRILSDSAKYDAACTSSGVSRKGKSGMVGNATACGICHAFAGDGRCISLLKILMTNICVFDCSYCVNRRSNDVERAAFTPDEIADITINFYRRNYIEGLFLSSAVVGTPDNTMELMIHALDLLRNKYGFNGYIHAKSIPGADSALVEKLGLLVDRMSVNIELPDSQSLALLAPQKSKTGILKPMSYISKRILTAKDDAYHLKKSVDFVPAGQSTQMIVGATGDSDYKIVNLSENLYKKYKLRRVFFSAYIPVGKHPALPGTDFIPPLRREHRLYQADWLLRFYKFGASEILDPGESLDPLMDPKCAWALRHPEEFPVEVNRASYERLLRVPGIGVTSAQRIIQSRRLGNLDFSALKRIGVVLKRARFFILCGGKYMDGLKLSGQTVRLSLITDELKTTNKLFGGFNEGEQQLSLIDEKELSGANHSALKVNETLALLDNKFGRQTADSLSSIKADAKPNPGGEPVDGKDSRKSFGSENLQW